MANERLNPLHAGGGILKSGRNYVINSIGPFTCEGKGKSESNNFGYCSSLEVRKFLVGKQVTVSADYTSTVTAGTIKLAILRSWQVVTTFSSNSAKEGHIQNTLVIQKDSGGSEPTDAAILYLQAAEGTEGFVTLTNVKLEIGDTATVWTLAPEDIVTKTEFDKLVKRVEALESPPAE